MNTSNCIEQKGVIDKILEHEIIVKVPREEACSNCSSESLCLLGKSENNYITSIQHPENFKIGEHVRVLISKSSGSLALFIGYVVPFILVLAVLIICIALKLSELTSGLLALSILPVYYSILYIHRKKIDQKFTFKIEKIKIA